MYFQFTHFSSTIIKPIFFKFEPNYRLCQQFVINELQSVMGVDGLITSHPINQPVHHPDEINQIFDRISYNKGIYIVSFLF